MGRGAVWLEEEKQKMDIPNLRVARPRCKAELQGLKSAQPSESLHAVTPHMQLTRIAFARGLPNFLRHKTLRYGSYL